MVYWRNSPDGLSGMNAACALPMLRKGYQGYRGLLRNLRVVAEIMKSQHFFVPMPAKLCYGLFAVIERVLQGGRSSAITTTSNKVVNLNLFKEEKNS